MMRQLLWFPLGVFFFVLVSSSSGEQIETQVILDEYRDVIQHFFEDLKIDSLPMENPPHMPKACPSDQVSIELAKRRFLKAKTKELRRKAYLQLKQTMENREYVDTTFHNIASYVANGDKEKTTFLLTTKTEYLPVEKCYFDMVKYFTSKCFRLNEYVAKKKHVLINLCTQEWAYPSAKTAMDKFCKPDMQDIESIF